MSTLARATRYKREHVRGVDSQTKDSRNSGNGRAEGREGKAGDVRGRAKTAFVQDSNHDISGTLDNR
jgi:hypothetical protein